MKASSSRAIVVFDPNHEGGVCHYSFGLCNALAARGHAVSLVSTRRRYELEKLPRRFDLIPLVRLEGDTQIQRIVKRLSPLRASRQAGAQIGAFVKSVKPIAVHQQWLCDPRTEPNLWDAMQKAAGAPVPLIYTAHNIFPHEVTPEEKPIYRAAYQRPARIITHGENLRREAIEDAHVPAEKLSVVRLGHYHFLADQFPIPTPEDARRSLGLESDDRVLLFFGFVRGYKGLDVLLLALEKLLSQRSSGARGRVRLLIAGKLPAGQKWHHSFFGGLSRALKIDDSLVVRDDYISLDDMGRYFAASDIACFPYRDGSQSASLQLAYAFSKPVVVARVGSLPEAVVEGETGLLVPPEDPQPLAEALASLVDDPDLCRKMGARGREWSGDECSWEKIAAQTLQIYEEVAASSNGARR